jgi:NTE family protein
MKRDAAALVVVLLAAFLAGCASRPVTPRLDQVHAVGYRWDQRTPSPGNAADTLLILTFSGGGTRAAAFSYGVLEELHRTRVRTAQGAETTALAQVDLVTGTSGGSFTALAYALYGERLFELYETAFLKRDVQGALIGRLIDPLDWPAVLSAGFGRSELAEAYYDSILFKGATFRDLAARPGPFVLAGATDVSTGWRIDFSQDQLDPMCVDLGALPLARAAAASSAVPGLLSPVTLDNRGGSCGFSPPAWMATAAAAPSTQLLGNRAEMRLAGIELLADSARRPYIHLVDGGLSDNLGVVSVVQALQEMMDSPAYRAALRVERLRRIAIVVVNARSQPDFRFDRQAAAPGTLSLLIQAVRVPMDRFSVEAIAALRDVITEWRLRVALEAEALRLGQPAPAGGALPAVEFFVTDVRFEAITDPRLRGELQQLPTSFTLSHHAVDRLRETGARLLRESPSFRAFLEGFAQPPAVPSTR